MKSVSLTLKPIRRVEKYNGRLKLVDTADNWDLRDEASRRVSRIRHTAMRHRPESKAIDKDRADPANGIENARDKRAAWV